LDKSSTLPATLKLQQNERRDNQRSQAGKREDSLLVNTDPKKRYISYPVASKHVPANKSAKADRLQMIALAASDGTQPSSQKVIDSCVLPNKRKTGSWGVLGLPVYLSTSTVDASATARVIDIPVVECPSRRGKAEGGSSGYDKAMRRGEPGCNAIQ